MTTELVKKETTTTNVVTPIELLSMAVSQGADLDRLEKLMELQRQWEQNEARKAYHQAVALFKTESIQILKNKTVTFKNNDGSETSYSHATLDHVLECAVPVLAKHGLTHSWSTVQGDGGRITVKCTLTHSAGYSDSVELSASPDDSGKKNNIQRMASTVTYLERYTFLAITGLAAKGQDDDAESTGERFDKQTYALGELKGREYGLFWYEHHDKIYDIKDQLADNNYLAAAEILYSFTNKELMYLAVAPTKNGIFTLEEKAKMDKEKNPLWADAVTTAIELNSHIDRSI